MLRLPSKSIKRCGQTALALYMFRHLPNTLLHSTLLTQALACYSRALELDASMVAARNNRAACLLKLGRWEEAAADCEAVLQVDGTNVKALLRRATARCAAVGGGAVSRWPQGAAGAGRSGRPGACAEIAAKQYRREANAQ